MSWEPPNGSIWSCPLDRENQSQETALNQISNWGMIIKTVPASEGISESPNQLSESELKWKFFVYKSVESGIYSDRKQESWWDLSIDNQASLKQQRRTESEEKPNHCGHSPPPYVSWLITILKLKNGYWKKNVKKILETVTLISWKTSKLRKTSKLKKVQNKNTIIPEETRTRKIIVILAR